MTDYDAIRELMPNLVPFVKTLGLEYLELDAGRAVLRLADDPAFHNHVGGPHAGALFTLAESAAGAVVLVDGLIVESGTPAELLRAGGAFAELFGDEVVAA